MPLLQIFAADSDPETATALYQSDAPFIRFGRDPDIDWPIENRHFSKHQGSFTAYIDSYMIANLGKNALHVNDQRCDHAFLKPGDQIRIADFRFQVQFEAAGCLPIALQIQQIPAQAEPTGPQLGDSYEFQQPPILIGRTKQADLILPSAKTSREHAQLQQQGQHWQIEALSHTNALIINGKAVRQHPLKHGDLIDIGGYRLQVDTNESTATGDATALYDDSLPASALQCEFGLSERVAINVNPFRIGRAQDANLRIQNLHISRDHAELRYDGAHWWLHKLSRNGPCKINQSDIEQQRLNPGDLINLGGFRMRFESELAASEHGISLLVTGPDDCQHVIPIDEQSRITLGQGEQCSLRLNDDRLLEQHLQIDFRHGGYFAQALNEEKPLRFNKQALDKMRLLDGDQIRFGRCRLQFRSDRPVDQNPENKTAD